MKRTLFITNLLFIALCGGGHSAFAEPNIVQPSFPADKVIAQVPTWASSCTLKLNSLLPQEKQFSSKAMEGIGSWTRREFEIFCYLTNAPATELTDSTAKDILAQLNKEFIPQGIKIFSDTSLQTKPDRAEFNDVNITHWAYYCRGSLNLYLPEAKQEKMFWGWRPIIWTRYEFAIFYARFAAVAPELKDPKATYYLECLKKEFAPELKRLGVGENFTFTIQN